MERVIRQLADLWLWFLVSEFHVFNAMYNTEWVGGHKHILRRVVETTINRNCCLHDCIHEKDVT